MELQEAAVGTVYFPFPQHFGVVNMGYGSYLGGVNYGHDLGDGFAAIVGQRWGRQV